MLLSLNLYAILWIPQDLHKSFAIIMLLYPSYLCHAHEFYFIFWITWSVQEMSAWEKTKKRKDFSCAEALKNSEHEVLKAWTKPKQRWPRGRALQPPHATIANSCGLPKKLVWHVYIWIKGVALLVLKGEFSVRLSCPGDSGCCFRSCHSRQGGEETDPHTVGFCP